MTAVAPLIAYGWLWTAGALVLGTFAVVYLLHTGKLDRFVDTLLPVNAQNAKQQIRAMNQERLARGEALPYDVETEDRRAA